MRKISLLVFVCSFTALFAQLPHAFRADEQPQPPDYSLAENWSALPFRIDAADFIPASESWISDSLKKVDVFYIYPTLYMSGNTWNADVQNQKLNKRIDRYPVKYQASVFNHVARVYAPRYRQAIIQAYRDSVEGPKALNFAYEDVKRAFQYYLDHYNQGRPIIIASHSQGTNHTRRLIKEFFDDEQKKTQLVCAYIVGFAVDTARYQVLQPCHQATATHCYVTWSSFRDGYSYPNDLPLVGNICVNPISWKLDTLMAESRGGVMFHLNKKKPFRTKAYRKGNYLMVRTKMPVVQTWNNLHLVDYNLFWYDIRANAQQRVDAYFQQTK